MQVGLPAIQLRARPRELDGGLDELRERVRTADETSQALRASFEAQESRIREARRTLEAIRADASQLEVARATAEADASSASRVACARSEPHMRSRASVRLATRWLISALSAASC